MLANVVIPSIGGKPLFVWGGMIPGVLLVSQLLTGLRVVKVPFAVHKYQGITLFAIACAHGFMGLMVWFGGWVY